MIKLLNFFRVNHIVKIIKMFLVLFNLYDFLEINIWYQKFKKL